MDKAQMEEIVGAVDVVVDRHKEGDTNAIKLSLKFFGVSSFLILFLANSRFSANNEYDFDLRFTAFGSKQPGRFRLFSGQSTQGQNTEFKSLYYSNK